jgi:hypothetical protein
MFKSISKIATSLMGLLTQPPMADDATRDAQCETIRQAMLFLIDRCDISEATTQLETKVFYARDIEALWFLRTNLLARLEISLGEGRAQAEFDAITRMFEGYLPAGYFTQSRGPQAGKTGLPTRKP